MKPQFYFDIEQHIFDPNDPYSRADERFYVVHVRYQNATSIRIRIKTCQVPCGVRSDAGKSE